MTKKQAFRTAVFFVLLVGILWGLNSLFVHPAADGTTARYRAFYKEEKENTWDAVYIGNSVVERAWVAPLAWHEHGIAVYSMSTDLQPMNLTVNVLKEVKKKQNVKLAIIDLRGIRESKLIERDYKVRRLTDSMQFSENRFDAINNAFEFAENYRKDETDLDDKISHYIPFLKYHSRWEELSETDFVKPVTKMKGVYEQTAFKIRDKEGPTITNSIGELSETQLKILTDIMNYAKENDIQLLFTAVPTRIGSGDQEHINRAFQIAEENGFPGINFNTEEMYRELGIDFTSDFCDTNHLNSKGARKLTAYLGKYLAENYDFKDKRGDEEYKSWDDAWEEYTVFYDEGWKKAYEKRAKKLNKTK